jgi:general secretion pathway protein E
MMGANDLRAAGIETGLKGAVKLYRGRGCNRCRQTGFRGRSAAFEVMPYSEAIRKMTTPKANFENIRIRAKEEGMVTLRENAIRKMMDGVTTYEEVLRVTSARKVVV